MNMVNIIHFNPYNGETSIFLSDFWQDFAKMLKYALLDSPKILKLRLFLIYFSAKHFTKPAQTSTSSMTNVKTYFLIWTRFRGIVGETPKLFCVNLNQKIISEVLVKQVNVWWILINLAFLGWRDTCTWNLNFAGYNGLTKRQMQYAMF
jgi:hypothetical protein